MTGSSAADGPSAEPVSGPGARGGCWPAAAVGPKRLGWAVLATTLVSRPVNRASSSCLTGSCWASGCC